MPVKSIRIGPVLLLLGAASSCSGNPLQVGESAKDSGVPVATLTGSVDLSQAPISLEMTCDRDVGSLALKLRCEIGQNIPGQNRDELGFNEVECHATSSGQPMVWSLLLVFSQILQHSDRSVTFLNAVKASPNQSVEYLPPPPDAMPTNIGGELFNISRAEGTISFARIDSPGRAFSGSLKGTFSWKSTTGSTFSCDVDGPFWGAPGGFL
jgi:hypothetical protein